MMIMMTGKKKKGKGASDNFQRQLESTNMPYELSV